MNRTLLVAALFVAAIATPLHAGFILNFDENGNGTISINGAAPQTFNGSLISDPTHAFSKVLGWNFGSLGLSFSLGDALIGDPTGGPSDLLRFTNVDGSLSGTGSIMIFYSGDTGGGLLADTGLPSTLATGISAVEDATGHFTYSPSPNVYNGLSGSSVPEPASVATLGFGLAALGLIARRRKNVVS
jgi:PEP-CTERM motif